MKTVSIIIESSIVMAWHRIVKAASSGIENGGKIKYRKHGGMAAAIGARQWRHQWRRSE
jgi:hypothetical protein